MTQQPLSPRELNRATLARQLLLERHPLGAAQAVGRLGGLQAQEPAPPYIALWSRLDGFGRDHLHAALHGRTLVRATWIRGTLHTVTADAYLAGRTALGPVLEAGARSIAGPTLDHDAIAAAVRRALAGTALTFNELRPLLAAEFPGANERALGYAARMTVPLVIVPTEDRWSYPREPAFTLADEWLGAPVPARARLDALVRDYLAAYGPASVADFQTWSGLRGAQAAFDALELVTFPGNRRRTLYDLPDAPRPEGAVPAPSRFLPDFDGMLLSHDDRTRIVAEEHRPALATKNLRVPGVFTVDGFAAGRWRLERKRAKATLTLEPFAPLPRRAVGELTSEGERLGAFAEPEAAQIDVVIV